MKFLTQHFGAHVQCTPNDRMAITFDGPTEFFRPIPRLRRGRPAWGWYVEIWWLYGVFRVQRLGASWDRNKERNRMMRKLKKLRKSGKRAA